MQKEKELPFLLLHKTSKTREALAVLFFLLVLLIFRFRVFTHFTSHFAGGSEGDAGLYIWLTRTNVENLFSLPWFTTRAFYPYGDSLAWSDNFMLPSLLAFPFLKLGLALPATYNFILLLATFLNGYLCYRLVYRLSASFPASLFAGASFMTSLFLGTCLGHPQLQFAFFIPLGISCYFTFLASPNVLRAALMSILIFLSFLTTVYYAIFLALTLVLSLLLSVLLRPAYLKKKDYLALLIGGTIGIIPIIPFLMPYFHVREAFGARALHEPFFFAANFLSYFSTSPWSTHYSYTALWSHTEAYLFPGCCTLLLSLFALMRLVQLKRFRATLILFIFCLIVSCVFSIPTFYFYGSNYLVALSLWVSLISAFALFYSMGKLERDLKSSFFTNRDLIALFALLALAAFTVSFGPLGYKERGDIALSPFCLLYYAFPGFDSIRAIGRISVLFSLSLAVLSGLGLAYFFAKKPLFAKFSPLLIALLLYENNITTYPLEPLETAPLVFSKLHDISQQGDVAVVLPFSLELNQKDEVKSWTDYARLNVKYMNWAVETKVTLLNGYSGIRSKLIKELPSHLNSFPQKRSIDTLKHIANLKYIVYSSRFDPAFEQSSFDAALKQNKDLEFISLDPEGNYLFRLKSQETLNSNSYFLIPSDRAGTFSFETSEIVPKTGKVSILLNSKKIDELNLSPNKEYQITLPRAGNPVPPSVLSFSFEAENAILIKNISFKEKGPKHG